MKNIFILLATVFLLTSCNYQKEDNIFQNPDKSIKVSFSLNSNKAPNYSIYYNNEVLIDSSLLGIIREDANFYNDLKGDKNKLTID